MPGGAADRARCHSRGQSIDRPLCCDTMSPQNRPISPHSHFASFGCWLEMESEAERERLEERRELQSSAAAERTGETLLDMVIRSHTTGLGGRYLVTFHKRGFPDRLPWHRFKVGSPVNVSAEGEGRTLQGVVSARRGDSLEIALGAWPEGERFRVDMISDEMTRKRQETAMAVAEAATGRLGQLRDLLLYHRTPTFQSEVEVERSEQLNDAQHEAVKFAMSANDLAVIHGPPGTGKTTTVVEIIRQTVANGQRVLACAPSNTAVDNLLERLVMAGVQAVRLGHPARVLDVVRGQTLDALVEKHETQMRIRKMLQEAEQLERKANRFTRRRPAPSQKYEQRQEARQLRKHARLLERHAIKDIINEAEVICATCSFDFSILEDQSFDLLVIDEACQSVEPACWVPLRFADRIVLAGDHCQLPPTILSLPAAREGFDVSLMQRLVEQYGDSVTRQLMVQHRMHEQIMQFSSQYFYSGTLVADSSVRSHRLTDLPTVAAEELDDTPVVYIDTAGAGWEEQQEPDGLSRLNPHEGRLVLDQVTALCNAGVSPRDIAVIAPYAAQVRWLRHHAEHEMLEVDTVDGFQGREKEAVIICTVRSNNRGEVGFLADARRMNVALTRARRKLIVIGDSDTLATDPFFAQLLQWFETSGATRSVWEIMPDL